MSQAIVKPTLRNLFNDASADRKAGSTAEPTKPVGTGFIPIQFPNEGRMRVCPVQDLFIDSPAFFRLMAKVGAYAIVKDTAVYAEHEGKLASADIIWVDGRPGKIVVQDVDDGAKVVTATKNDDSAAEMKANIVFTTNIAGKEEIVMIDSISGSAISYTLEKTGFTMELGGTPTVGDGGIHALVIEAPESGKATAWCSGNFAVSAVSDAEDGNYAQSVEIDLNTSHVIFVSLKEGLGAGECTGELFLHVSEVGFAEKIELSGIVNQAE